MQAVFVIYYYNTCIMSILDSIEENLIDGEVQMIKHKIYDAILECANYAYSTNQFRGSMALNTLKRVTLLNLLAECKLRKKDIDLLLKHNVITTLPINKILERRVGNYGMTLTCKDFSISKLITIYNRGYVYDLGEYVSIEEKEKLYEMPKDEYMDVQVYFGNCIIQNVKVNFTPDTHKEFLNIVKKEFPTYKES